MSPIGRDHPGSRPHLERQVTAARELRVNGDRRRATLRPHADARRGPAARIGATTSGAVDCGDFNAARYLEPFVMTWNHMAIRLGHGRRVAFARLRR